jgi:hypothetical protein
MLGKNDTIWFSYCDIQYPSICALVLDWWAVTRQSRDSHELMNYGLEGWLETRTAEVMWLFS